MKSELPPAPESYRRSHKLLGPVLHKLHMSCHHFSELNLLSMDRRLSLKERIPLLLHFCICGMCRKVTKQMKSLRALVRASVMENQLRQPDPDFIARVRGTLVQIASESDSPGKQT